MKIYNYYNNKTVLVTGVTGFVGKVIFEKILRVLPSIKQIYVLMRNKKGTSVLERFKKQIMSSMIFERLRKIKGDNFDKYIAEKVTILEGDLLLENVGLTQ
jgi:thioester reductase-like protein